MKYKNFTLLYIGNKLQKHGKTPTSIDTLSLQLESLCDVLSTSDKLNIILRMGDIILSIIKYKKQTNAILIDTYSSLNFYISLISAFLANFFKIDYYLYLHGGNLPMRLKKNPRLSKYLFSHSKVNIAPSGYLKNAFEKEGYKVEFIPNNIDISMYPFKPRSVLAPNILYVRAFSEIYNPQMAIEAFVKVYKKYPEAKMCMVGPDKDGSMQLCKELCSQLNVEHAVEFTGRLEKSEWIRRSEEFDLFINSTNFDNQPVSIIEAMALGLPIVSTNVGGIPFLIQNEKDGLLCAKNSSEEMASCILRLLDNKDLASRLSEEGLSKAQSYSWDSVKSRWEKLLFDKGMIS